MGKSISGNLKLSASTADAEKKLVTLSIESDGLKGQILDSDILSSVQSALDLKQDAGDYVLASDDVTSQVNVFAGTVVGLVPLSEDTGLKYLRDDGTWQVVSGGGSESTTVSDSNSIDLTLTGNDISADLILSSDVAQANYRKVSLSVKTNGLHAEISEANILGAVQSELDAKANSSTLSDHINDSTDAHAASAISVSTISGVVGDNAQTILENLKTQIDLKLESSDLSSIESDISALQSDVLNKADQTDLDAHLNDSADAHDASAISVVAISGVTGSDAQAVLEDLKTQIDLKLESSDLSTIEGNISDIQSDILAINQEATSVADSNSIDFSLTGNQISGDLKLSAASAETGKIKAGLDIQSDGLRAQINKSDIEGVIDLYENIDNANIASNAAIALSKLATVTASKVLVSDSSGNISASLVSDTSLGYLDATSSIQTQLDDKRSISNNIVTVSGTTRTLELSDAWKYLRVTANATVTITIPLNASVAFPVGTEIEFFQVGTGPVNFELEEGVSGYPFSIADQYQQVKIKKIDTDSWDIFGSVAVI